MCLIKCIRKIPNPSLENRTLEPQSSYVTFAKIIYPVRWELFTSQMGNKPSQQLISSVAAGRKRGCSSRQKNPPILNCGMKGVGADTSHHRSDLVLNIRLGARVFIYNIFPKNQRHASKQLLPRRLTNQSSGNSKQTPILLFQCVLF